MTEMDFVGVFGKAIDNPNMALVDRAMKSSRLLKRKVSGICGTGSKTRERVLEILEEIGIASNSADAKEIFGYMTASPIPYRVATDDHRGTTFHTYHLREKSKGRFTLEDYSQKDYRLGSVVDKTAFRKQVRSG